MGAMKDLSADGLVNLVRDSIEQEAIKPIEHAKYSWSDCLMSGLAIFGFKYPSLLQFDKERSLPAIKKNLRSLYGVKEAPSDTTLRKRLDQLSPAVLRRPFKKILAKVQRAGLLKEFQYLKEKKYIISVDGTGQYSSKQVYCKNCCQKHHRNGEVTYSHQLLGASIVHPEKKIVIPLAPEPIIKADGSTKNDCERNASKRMLREFRREPPHLPAVIVEDSLASNYPHLSLLDELNLDYIIGVKPGDHKYLFEFIDSLSAQSHRHTDEKGTEHSYSYYHKVPLNASHDEYEVNVLVYTEKKKNGSIQKFSWVTKLSLTADTVEQVMRAARARWRIENETFNTLKNQGYHFEHNYGHGYENLCSVMSMLMMLAFLIDQVQRLCFAPYQQARDFSGSFRVLCEKVRVLIQYVVWDSFEQLFTATGRPKGTGPPGVMFFPNE